MKSLSLFHHSGIILLVSLLSLSIASSCPQPLAAQVQTQQPVSSVSDQNGMLTFEYDEVNRLTRFTNAANQTIRYDYDRNGNVTVLTYPDGKIVRYEYDAANRLRTVTDWLGNATAYDYDLAGNLRVSRNSNGTLTEYQYDAAQRLTSLINAKSDGTIISAYRYTLDHTGNRISVVTSEPLLPARPSASTNYTYDPDNRIQTSGIASFTHDANGNLLTESGPFSRTYTYDAFNRLIQITSQNYNAWYQYDRTGGRTSRIVNGVEEKQIITPGGRSLLVATDGDGNPTAYYVYGAGLISQVTPQGQAYFYHFDGVGSTVAMTDSTGGIVNRYIYDAFGVTTAVTENVPNPFKYLGGAGVIDEGNGLLYMRARYYNARIGRFINRDSMGLAERGNLYEYAGNNPVNLALPDRPDPSIRPCTANCTGVIPLPKPWLGIQ